MKNCVVGLVCLVIVTFAPAVSSSQVFPLGASTGSFLPSMTSLPGIGSFEWGNVRVTPSVYAGFQEMSLNMNVPVADRFIAGFTLETHRLDLSLQDANLWIGGVRLIASIPSGLVLSLQAEGNASRRTEILMFDSPFWPGRGVDPITWTGSQFEWWHIDGRAGYPLGGLVSVIGGIKFEHISFGLTDPRDPFGVIVGRGSVARVDGDLTAKVTCPYVGIQLNGPSYQFDVVWSPFLWTSIEVPINSLTLILGGVLDGSDYSLKRGGFLLESRLEYLQSLPLDFDLGVWVKGSLLKSRGTGHFEIFSDYPFGLPSDTDSATSTFTRSIVACGVSGTLPF